MEHDDDLTGMRRQGEMRGDEEIKKRRRKGDGNVRRKEIKQEKRRVDEEMKTEDDSREGKERRNP